jgi:hypothetical protein
LYSGYHFEFAGISQFLLYPLRGPGRSSRLILSRINLGESDI